MITLEIDDSSVLAALARLREKVENLQPPMDEIGNEIKETVRMTFSDGADPWGAPWRPLSALTLSRRRQGAGPGSAQPLRDTGALYNSFSYRADADSVTVGTNLPYAKTHQFGATQGAYGKTKRNGPMPWGNVPARPFMPIRDGHIDLPDELQRSILEIISDHLSNGIND